MTKKELLLGKELTPELVRGLQEEYDSVKIRFMPNKHKPCPCNKNTLNLVVDADEIIKDVYFG